MERMGPAGLSYGELNDRPLFDTIVRVLPGGREAIARGIELGLLGDAEAGTAHWEISVFRNRFVKEDGLWKLKELRLFPLMKADYFVGWGRGGLAGSALAAAMFGLRDVLQDKPKEDIVIQVDADGDPPDIDLAGLDDPLDDGARMTGPALDDLKARAAETRRRRAKPR